MCLRKGFERCSLNQWKRREIRHVGIKWLKMLVVVFEGVPARLRTCWKMIWFEVCWLIWLPWCLQTLIIEFQRRANFWRIHSTWGGFLDRFLAAKINVQNGRKVSRISLQIFWVCIKWLYKKILVDSSERAIRNIRSKVQSPCQLVNTYRFLPFLVT